MIDHKKEGLVLISWASEDLGLDLDCWFDYEPAEQGARERGTGLQLEPDYPETWTLCHVYLPGSNVDITPVMSSKLIALIEEDIARGDESWEDFDSN
jgi:hypothetical protein